MMNERETEVKTFIVDKICNECGIGKMQQEGDSYLATNPPQYPHKCDHCGHCKNIFSQPYPRIVYKKVENE